VITGGGPPPVAIADLRVNVRGMLGSENEDLEAAANLTWSAPADSSGNAVGSYLFLAGVDDSCPITAGNQASQPVRQQPGTTPGAPGSKETFDLFVPTNLLTDNVCFAIIAIDKTGVFSNLSNVALPPVGVSDLDQGDATNDTSADLGMSQPVFQAGTTPAPFQYALVPAPGGGNCPQFGSQLAGLPGATLTPIAGLENQHQLPITGLTPNTNYCVALLSTDTAGDSAWSNVAPVNTTDQSAPPPPPNVAVTGTTDTTISIQFDSVVDNDRAQTGVALQYDVVYQAVADCSQFQPNADQSFDETGVITAPGQHVDVTLEGLTPVTHYCFFVNATNGGGQVGNGSATFDATTQAPGGGNGGPRPAAITTLPRRRR
jgi:hypothetical protein